MYVSSEHGFLTQLFLDPEQLIVFCKPPGPCGRTWLKPACIRRNSDVSE